MAAYILRVAATEPTFAGASKERWELYRLLAEPVRLKLLALSGEEELAIGELAELLNEGQPNVSRHIAPLKQSGLVIVRKQGTRALVRLSENASRDPVVADALVTGRALCAEDGSLDRIAEVLRARDAQSRAFFATQEPNQHAIALPTELGAYLAAIAPLIPNRRLAVDAGTGDGGLLDALAPIFEHVVAFDREDAQLARCRDRLALRGYDNVELVSGAVESEHVRALVDKHGGADAVFAARFLHHAAKPAAAVRALAELVREGGHVVILDYARHDDEAMREQADLWLGFDAQELRRFARDAELEDIHVSPVPMPRVPLSQGSRALPDAHLSFQVMVAKKISNSHSHTNERKRPS